MVGGYHWIHQEDFSETFGVDVKSDLTAISSQKSQNWNCYEGKSNQGPNTKVKEDNLRFQRFTQGPQPVNGLRVMIFGRWHGCWNFIFVQIAASKENQFWGCSGGILPLSWIPKTWKSIPDFYPLLIQPSPTNCLEVTEFEDRLWCWILFLDKIAAERNSTFGSRIGRNSRSPKYHYGRQLSQLSDGQQYGPEQLKIYELRLSETRPVYWIRILDRLDLSV
jgi:hypothetical protein